LIQNITDDSPGIVLFPEYGELYDLVVREVGGMTEAQLDFCSDQWAWAEWSIRYQLSHMAFVPHMWLLVRWGDTLFPDGDHGVEDLQGLVASGFDRRLDEHRYRELQVILEKLHSGIELAQRILTERNVGFLRGHTYLRDFPDHWRLMKQAHRIGITPADDPSKLVMTLEATFRHIYFEELTHLYNIQRLKRAQRLSANVEVPHVGYWVLDGWDHSEAG
jgi:hypothetical protein